MSRQNDRLGIIKLDAPHHFGNLENKVVKPL